MFDACATLFILSVHHNHNGNHSLPLCPIGLQVATKSSSGKLLQARLMSAFSSSTLWWGNPASLPSKLVPHPISYRGGRLWQVHPPPISFCLLQLLRGQLFADLWQRLSSPSKRFFTKKTGHLAIPIISTAVSTFILAQSKSTTLALFATCAVAASSMCLNKSSYWS